MAEVKTKISTVAEPLVEKKEEIKKAAQKTTTSTEEKVKKAAGTTKKAAVKAADTTKKAAVKAATATKETAMKAKEVVKKVLQNEMHIEFPDITYTQADFEKIAKDVWVYDMGRKASEFKSVALYVKPLERRVYFVVNGTDAGDFRI